MSKAYSFRSKSYSSWLKRSEAYYRENLTIGNPLFTWGSALWGGIESFSKETRSPCACSVGFVGVLEGYGPPETSASVVWVLLTAYLLF